jgi:hypothetical protein
MRWFRSANAYPCARQMRACNHQTSISWAGALITWCLLAFTVIGCGNAATSPSSSGFNPDRPPPGFNAGRVQMRLDVGSVANRNALPGGPSVQYSACGQIINAGPGDATMTVTMTVFGPDGNAYAATQSVQKMYPDGSSSAGCGLVVIIDREIHADPVRYRLHIHYVFADRSVGDLEAEARFR